MKGPWFNSIPHQGLDNKDPGSNPYQGHTHKPALIAEATPIWKPALWYIGNGTYMMSSGLNSSGCVV